MTRTDSLISQQRQDSIVILLVSDFNEDLGTIVKTENNVVNVVGQ